MISETGAGAQAAAGAAGSLFARFAPTLWIGAGLAGALSPELPFGAIVVSGEIVDERGSPVARPDEEMARRALACDPAARLGRVVCADGIVYSAAQKQRLRESAAGPFPAAVDLESSAWARAGAGVRGLVVRAISDAADDEIPAFVAAAVTSGGEIERKRLVRYALLHPRSIGKLLELRRRARFCGDRLADFLERFAGNGF